MVMLNELQSVLNSADCLFDEQQVVSVLDEMAVAIENDYKALKPLVLCVMNGGYFITAELLSRLSIPIEFDYVHASRYRGNITGGEIEWHAKPKTNLQNRHVLIIDDIYDEGITLQHITNYCQLQNPASVEVAVLTRKQHQRAVVDLTVKYIGLDVPDRYVFGCGMDYQGYFRNLNAIYALV